MCCEKCKCVWKINNDECEGEIRVIDLFPGSDVKDFVDGHSIHAMPVCEGHLKDHINVARAVAKGKLDEAISNVSRANLQKYDPKMS